MSENTNYSLTNLISILDTFQDDILIVDSTGIVIEANVQAKTNLFPDFKTVAREDLETTLAKMSEQNGVENPTKLLESIRQAQKSNFLNVKEKIKLKKNNRDKFYEVVSSPIFEQKSGFKGRIWLFRDITKSELAKIERSDFLSLAAHKLKTPIDFILTQTNELLAENETIPNEIKTKLLSIQKASSETCKLVSDLLNIATLEKQHHALKPAQIDLKTFTGEVIESLSEQIKAKNIKISANVEKDVPIIISDLERLKESVKNLMDNSIKYSKSGGIVEILISKSKDTVSIKLKDYGIGIPKEDQPLLFSKFFRASNAWEEHQEGTGIGLYYVRKAVQDLKGHIAFQSEENVGSVFEILLPLKI